MDGVFNKPNVFEEAANKHLLLEQATTQKLLDKNARCWLGLRTSHESLQPKKT